MAATWEHGLPLFETAAVDAGAGQPTPLPAWSKSSAPPAGTTPALSPAPWPPTAGGMIAS